MSNKFFMPCKEANHVCDKSQYKEASLLEKIKLTIHLIYCSACRKYTKKNAKLTKLVTKKPVTMDTEAKESLKSIFEKELAKHQ